MLEDKNLVLFSFSRSECHALGHVSVTHTTLNDGNCGTETEGEDFGGFFLLFTLYLSYFQLSFLLSHSFLLAFNFPSLSLSIQPDRSHRFCLT